MFMDKVFKLGVIFSLMSKTINNYIVLMVFEHVQKYNTFKKQKEDISLWFNNQWYISDI